jgi:hypothetical protein
VTVTTRPAPTPTPSTRSRTRRLFWPVTGVVAALGGAAYVRLVDPNLSVGYPPCPLKVLTGLDCPGCGGLRCVHSLMEGNVGAALDQNLLAVILLPLVALWIGLLLVRKWRSDSGPPVRSERFLAIQRVATIVLIAVIAIFTIVRNIPGIGFLPSGLG